MAGGKRAWLALETVITGRPNQARSFVRACRSDITGPDRFSLGYCQGFIASKVGRLSEAKIDDVELRRKRLQGPASVLGSSIMLDIMHIIRSSYFDDRNFGEFQRLFGRPLTVEDVLDHVIDNLLYVEKP